MRLASFRAQVLNSLAPGGREGREAKRREERLTKIRAVSPDTTVRAGEQTNEPALAEARHFGDIVAANEAEAGRRVNCLIEFTPNFNRHS